MSVKSIQITFNTHGNAEMVNITDQVSARIAESGMQNGIVALFCPSSTSALTTLEFAPWSPGLDWGALLPNFNDGFFGLGPDVGAYERGLPPLEFGVDAYRATLRPATPGGESVAPRVPVFSQSDPD